MAIAAELRKLHPDLEIDWLAQHPVTAVLEAHGERIHPLSAELASESAHITAESADHDLNAFQAIRRMDEILVTNFMVFHDAVEGGEYDLVIGDEAWDVDYFLHENPELKRTAFAWMTDFVGWLPMPSGGDREAFLTADYNAEMIEQVERFPRIRDRAIFVGEPDDIVPDDFGPGLGPIRDWTERHYAFSGYVTGFDPTPLIEGREELRRELGYQPDERVVIVTVGGSGVGEALLRRVIDELSRRGAAGERAAHDRRRGPAHRPGFARGRRPGVEVRAFVPDLYRHLAACDLAVVQGGLTTTMELAAARRPFLYFPLRDHFEQNRHVRHRLDRYGAGRYMEYAASPPEVIAAAIAEEIDRPIDYRPVETDGAARAAALIAPLLWSSAGHGARRLGRGPAALRQGLAQQAQDVAAHDRADARGREPVVEQGVGDLHHPGRVERHRDRAVEVGAEPDVVDPDDRHGVPDRAGDGGRVVAAARRRPEPDADDAAGRGHAADLLVGQVADVVGHAADARVRDDDRAGRDGERVVDRGRRRVRQVEEHRARLHPPDHLATEVGQAALLDAMRRAAVRRYRRSATATSSGSRHRPADRCCRGRRRARARPRSPGARGRRRRCRAAAT